MNKREMKLNEMYIAHRDGLIARFATSFNRAGGYVEDAFAKAFEFAARGLLAKPGDFDATDFKNLVCYKMERQLKDCVAESQRTHGRRSVKAMAILDEEQKADDDRRVALVDRWSMARYAEARVCEGDENLVLLQAKAIDCVLMKHGVSARDRDIFDRCTFCSPKREALAAEFQTSVSNVGRIKCECGQLVAEYAPEIRSCYSALKRQYEMACC